MCSPPDSDLPPGPPSRKRVQQRSRRAVAVLAWIAACAPVVGSADVLRIIDSGKEAAQVRADLIRGAHSEIALEFFRTTNDRVALYYLALLREAARRGVRVRVVVDAYFNSLPKALQAHLRQEGVAIKEYHPFRLTRLRWVTRRLHDKLLLRDQQEMLVGGRNLENPFFEVPPERVVKATYVDRDIYVRGEAAGAAATYFTRLWTSAELSDTALGIYDPDRLRHPCDPAWDEQTYGRCHVLRTRALADIAHAAALIDASRAELGESGFVDLGQPGDWSQTGTSVRVLRFHHDPVGAKGAQAGTFEAFLELVASARRHVFIESPYLVLSERTRAVLHEAIARGVRVRVLTNSLAAAQNLYAQSSYEHRKQRLLGLGLEIWEYQGPSTLHAKSAVIDDAIAVVGNFNLDPRSERLNTELAVIVHDEQAAARLRASMDANLANAWRIGADGRPLGQQERFPGVSACRIMKLRMHQLLLPLIEGQL